MSPYSQSSGNATLSGGLQDSMEPFLEWTSSEIASKCFRLKGITNREREVFTWLIQGKTNWEIAAILGISTHTVSKHLEHVFLKLKVHSRLQAFNKALEWYQNEQWEGFDHISNENIPRAEVA